MLVTSLMAGRANSGSKLEKVNVMESAGGPLVLALHSLCFLSASQIFFIESCSFLPL